MPTLKYSLSAHKFLCVRTQTFTQTHVTTRTHTHKHTHQFGARYAQTHEKLIQTSLYNIYILRGSLFGAANGTRAHARVVRARAHTHQHAVYKYISMNFGSMPSVRVARTHTSMQHISTFVRACVCVCVRAHTHTHQHAAYNHI